MKNFVRKAIATLIAVLMVVGYMTLIPSTPVKADVRIQDLYADYTEITYLSHMGNKIKVFVDGDSIGIKSNCITEAEIKIASEETEEVISSAHSDKSFIFKPNAEIEPGKFYPLYVTFWADGRKQTHDRLYISARENGNLTFLKSLVYDFNVERTAEWLTDEQSLKECLQPQNDVECDDPAVIKYAEHITKGCNTDWEKAYAIYNFFVEEYAYDYVQIADRTMSYQDDPLALIRRKIAVCEGFGNTYAALCRAVGIPAVVCFGIGSDAYEYTHNPDCLKETYPNHAWAAVFLDGHWYSLDATWDLTFDYNGTAFYTGTWEGKPVGLNWYLVPLEDFSMTHMITDADTIHGLEREGSCGEDATYKITRDGTLTIYGSGEISLPKGVDGFNKIVFDKDSNITVIGKECFEDSDLITSVIIPDTVKRIEEHAFWTCEDLEYIYIPEGVEYIGMGAFDYCDELAYVSIPDSVKTIDKYAFDDCSRLIIEIPSSLKGFDDGYMVRPARIINR